MSGRINNQKYRKIRGRWLHYDLPLWIRQNENGTYSVLYRCGGNRRIFIARTVGGLKEFPWTTATAIATRTERELLTRIERNQEARIS